MSLYLTGLTGFCPRVLLCRFGQTQHSNPWLWHSWRTIPKAQRGKTVSVDYSAIGL